MAKKHRTTFGGEMHLCRQHVRTLFDEETLDRLLGTWMKDPTAFPKNWIQKGLKSLAEDRMEKDFRLY